MQLRKLRVALIPVVAAAVALAGSSPAGAGGTGNGLAAGVVTGTVNTNPGVPTDPTAPATSGNFTFDTTTIAGSVTVTDGTSTATYEGTIDVDAAGTATDDTATGTGKVTSLAGAGSSATGSITVSLGALTTLCSNTFVRVGFEVVVLLKITATVTMTTPLGTTTVTGLICVQVVATFASTTTAGNITTATFAGSFTGEPVVPV